MANKQAVLGSGARFTGKISNAKSIEFNGYVRYGILQTHQIRRKEIGNRI